MSLAPRIPPRPGPPHPSLRRAIAPPPTIGADKVEDAVYVLDTGVGLAFAHAGLLDLLAKHYDGVLVIVDDVLLEWKVQARTALDPLEPGHTADDKAARDRRVRIRAAATAVLTATEDGTLPEAIELDLEEQKLVDVLVHELKGLPPRKPADGGDRGECASVHLATKLRAAEGLDIVLLCSDDNRARDLAARHQVNCRTHHTVLREMVREGRLDAQDAFDAHETMCEVSDLAVRARPGGPDDFT